MSNASTTSRVFAAAIAVLIAMSLIAPSIAVACTMPDSVRDVGACPMIGTAGPGAAVAVSDNCMVLTAANAVPVATSPSSAQAVSLSCTRHAGPSFGTTGQSIPTRLSVRPPAPPPPLGVRLSV